MPNNFKVCPKYFSKGVNNFVGVALPLRAWLKWIQIVIFQPEQ